MKVFIFLILFILIYYLDISNESFIKNDDDNNNNNDNNNSCNNDNLIINNSCYSYNNNDLIINNIYVNKLGNDTSNNGTAEYPFYSICKVISFINENLNPSNQINVYIGPGEFNCTECKALFEGYIEINFYGIQGVGNGIDQSGSNNITNLIDFQLDISESNFLLENVNYTIYRLQPFNISNSYFKFQNSTFLYGNMYRDDIKFRDSTIEFNSVVFGRDFNYRSIKIQNSTIQINYSSLFYSNIVFDTNGGLFSNNSSHLNENMVINDNSLQIIIEYNNCILGDFQYTINTGNHSLSFIGSQLNFKTLSCSFYLVYGNSLNLIDSQIIGNGGNYIESNLVYCVGGRVKLQNLTVSNIQVYSELIFSVSSQISVINCKFKDINTNYGFYLFQSQLYLESLDSSTISNSSSFILVQVASLSNVTFNNVFQGQGTPIYISPNSNQQKSIINIKDSNFRSIGNLGFINSKVIMHNLNISNIQNNNAPLFSVVSSHIALNSINIFGGNTLASSYLFSLQDVSTLEIDNLSVNYSSNLILASSNSTISIINSFFNNILGKDIVTISIAQYSNLYMHNIYFNSISCTDQSFLYALGSKITIETIDFKKLSIGPQPFLVLDSSVAKISFFSLESSFFENSILYINNKSNIEMSQSSISSSSNNGKAIIVQDQSVLSINGCYFMNNIFSNLFFINYSTFLLKSTRSIESAGVLLYSVNSSFSTLSQIDLKFNPAVSIGYFFVIQDSRTEFNNVNIEKSLVLDPILNITHSTISILSFSFHNNIITLAKRNSIFNFYDSIIQFDNSTFSNNSIRANDNLFTAYYGRTSFIDCYFSENSNHYENGVFYLASNSSSLYIRDSLMEENQFQLGTIQIFNKSSISIINSTFSFNSNNGNGGVFYIDENSFVIDLLYSSFFNNSASVGGAIFSNFYFNYSSYFYLGNQFIGNKAIYGNNIASSPFQINIIFPDDNYTLDKNTNTNFQVLDIFNNLISNLNYVANIYINKLYVNSSITETLKPIIVKGGIGSFNYTYFAPESLLQFLVVINIPELNLTRGSYKDKSKCSNYQLYNTTTGVCSFCPPNQVALNGNCSECPSTLKCFNQEIFSITNYYLIINNSTNENSTNNFNSFDFKIYQCPPQICKSSNECYSSLANGNLCSRCLTDQQIDNYYKDISTFPSVSKNSLHCCSYFKPVLIIGFIFFIFSFGILLSLYKFNIRNSLITPIILMIQWNSIIFYSYKGFYIIPLFRLSTDYIENYCTFKINYLEKSIISIISTFIIFFIGTSNIGTVIIEYLLSIKRLPKQKLLKLIPKSIINNIKLSKKHRYNNNQLSSQWNIFLILLQPLLFITTSLIIPKKINNQQFLSIDISILYNYFITQWILLIFSFILLFIILIIIPIRFFIYHYKNNQISKLTINNNHSRYDNSSNNNNNNSIYNNNNSIYNRIIFQNISNHYRKGYKWWDLLFIFKSFSFSILSISMLYSSDFYLLSVTLIHLFYSYIQFILHPQKNNIIYKVENATNLCQLINLIIIDSNLYKSFPPELSFNIGTLITITSFINIIIIITIYIFRFKFKNK